MCLERLNKITHRSGVGYKVCNKVIRDGKNFFESWDCSFTLGTPYPLNRWTTDERKKQIGYNPTYPTGFHVALSKMKVRKIAKNCSAALILVKYKNVVAQENRSSAYGTVVVARDIINKGEIKIKQRKET